MAGLGDLMARSQAAGGMMGGGEAPAMDPSMGAPPMEPAPESEAPDIESGASIIEAFAESVDPSTGDQIREHLNAIRELAANSAPMEEAAALPEEAPPPEGGAPEEMPQL